MSRKYHFTREEIAAELQRCGYPLTSDDDVARFERDLAALYAEGKYSDDFSDSSYCASDKFYDLPPPLRDDVDFSKYYIKDYTKAKSQTSDCLGLPTKSLHYTSKTSTDDPKSAPSSARGEKSSTSSNTKRKVLRRSEDGSSYIDELMYGRKLPPISKQNGSKLPLVLDDDVDDDDLEMPPLSYGYGRDPIEDKFSRLTLVSEGGDSSESPVMRRPYEAHSKPRKSGDHSPLRASDRDNRQANSKANNKTAGSSSGDSGFLPSVICRPVQAVTTKPTKRSGGAQDPVSRYAAYAKAWRNQRAPGEKAHKELRWQIRGQMLSRDEVVVANQGRRPPASNAAVAKPNYVVPTEKKRQALRWAIRSALAAGRQPPTTTRYTNRAFLSG